MPAHLKNYNATAQHYGTWLSGYHWNAYCCGTYRNPVGQDRALKLMNIFMERLERKLRAPVSYVAGLERRYSGCGHSPVAVHWHFLAASNRSEAMVSIANRIWQDKFGNCKIERYDPRGNGSYYVAKVVSHRDGELVTGKLDLLQHHGPSDLPAAAEANPYVPDRLAHKVFGNYGVVREALEMP